MRLGLYVRVVPDTGGLLSLGAIRDGILSLDLWFVWAALLAFAIILPRVPQLQTKTRVLEIATIVGTAVILPFGYIRLYYLDYVIKLYLYPILFGLAAYGVFLYAKQQYPAGYRQTVQTIQDDTRLTVAAASALGLACWVALTFLMSATYH